MAQIRTTTHFRFVANAKVNCLQATSRPAAGSKTPLFNVILYQPEIPPNTGNIIRLCANTGAHLHLIEPLGFELDSARVRRAGLDYHEMANVSCYPGWEEFLQAHPDMIIWAFSSKANRSYSTAKFHANDGLLFGPETRGLPKELINSFGAERALRLPMQADSRSLNLSNTVAVALYEALRQTDFCDLK
jgi:tRNA (cytidine/uridine-2'-O-)-methyltransferase